MHAAKGSVGREGEEDLGDDGLGHGAVPKRMGAKCEGPLDR